MAKLVKCPDCGSDVSVNAATCPKCGAVRKGNLHPAVVVIVLIIVAAILAFVAISIHKHEQLLTDADTARRNAEGIREVNQQNLERYKRGE